MSNLDLTYENMKKIEKKEESPETNKEKKTWVEPKMDNLVIENIDPGPGFDGSGRLT